MLFYLLWSVPLLSRSVIFPLPIRSLVSCDLQSHSCPSSSSLLFLLSRSAVSSLAVCSRTAVPHLPVCCFFSPDTQSHLLRSAVSQLSLLFRFAAFPFPICYLTSCDLQSRSCPSSPRLWFHLPRVAVCLSLTSRYSRSFRSLPGFLVVCALLTHWSALYNRALCLGALTGCLVIHPVTRFTLLIASYYFYFGGYRPAFLPVVSCCICFRSSRSAAAPRRDGLFAFLDCIDQSFSRSYHAAW